jgi:hypothetical protein
MSTIPNELKITINTSIPGFQSIRYKPSMTLPNEKNDDSIQFNPLVKLKSSVIKSLPESVQKKEFFNKGLFQSLVNSHGLVKNKSLVEATKDGFIDNNIKVTLETLFPSNSVLYINKQPYVITDVQWTKGDWKIDKKVQHVPQLESSRLRDPYLYNTVVKDEIISGENEMRQLPKEIIYGSNYTGPTNVASGIKPFVPSTNIRSNSFITPTMGSPRGQYIKSQSPPGVRPMSPTKPIKPIKTIKPTKPIKPVPIVTPIKPTSLPSNVSLAYEAKEREIQKQYLNLVQKQKQLLQQQQFVSQQLLNQENKLSKEKRALFLQEQQQIAKEREKLKLQQELLSQELNILRLKFESQRLKMFRNKEIMDSTNKYPYGNPFDTPDLPPDNPYGNPFNRPALPPSAPEIVEDEEIIEKPIKKIVLELSKKSTEKLQTFFKNSNYYLMLNIMFQNMEAPEKDKINEIFKEATGVDAKAVKGLSKSAYDKTVINMKVIKNAGGGDCFFIAVADAINYYNANVNANANKITYENNYGIKTPFTQLALRKIVSYFILFENETPFEQLVTILEYKVKDMNDMFQIAYETFINDVGSVTPNIFFDLIDNIYKNPEIDNFLVKKPTEMTSETVQNPFRMITKNELETYITSSDYWGNPIAINALCEILGLNVVVIENINNIMRAPYIYHGNKEWNKYVFIYHEVDHYELITFDFVFNNKQSPVTKIIFKNNFLNPPFYIIFLIFASNYYKIREQIDKKQFKLLPILMKNLFDIYNKIELNSRNSSNSSKKIKKTSDKFLTLFNDYFLKPPILRRDKSFEGISSKSIYTNPFEGGALNPYQYNRVNNRPYQTQTQLLPRSPYLYSFIKKPPQTQLETPQSNISYYISIDMYLKKGSELSDKDISSLNCLHRLNSIRKNYADLRGIKYSPIPDYNMLPSSYTKTSKSSSSSNNNKSKTKKESLDLKRKNNRTRKRNYLSS